MVIEHRIWKNNLILKNYNKKTYIKEKIKFAFNSLIVVAIFFSLLPHQSFGQDKSEDYYNQKTIISKDFKDSDSLVIRIEITQGKDILFDSQRSFLTIFILPNKNYMIYQPSEGETQQIIADRKKLINSVIEFEKISKSNKI